MTDRCQVPEQRNGEQLAESGAFDKYWNMAKGNEETVTEAPRLQQHGGPGTSGPGSTGRSTSLEKKGLYPPTIAN